MLLVAIARQKYGADAVLRLVCVDLEPLLTFVVSVLVTSQYVVGVHGTAFTATIPRLPRMVDCQTGRTDSRSFVIS